VGVYAGFLERIDVRLGIAAEAATAACAADFSAAVADKHKLDLLFEIRHVPKQESSQRSVHSISRLELTISPARILRPRADGKSR
jgi:hypothetical protein